MSTRKRFMCRFCGAVLPAWLPVAKRPNGAMLLHRLSDMHPAEIGPYLARMRTKDIATVAGRGLRGDGGEISDYLHDVDDLAWRMPLMDADRPSASPRGCTSVSAATP